jgi:hypothetical protein
MTEIRADFDDAAREVAAALTSTDPKPVRGEVIPGVWGPVPVSDDVPGWAVTMVVSPDFGAYASGRIGAAAIRCVLCGVAPCDCPPFGTPEYLALVDRLHGRGAS